MLREVYADECYITTEDRVEDVLRQRAGLSENRSMQIADMHIAISFVKGQYQQVLGLMSLPVEEAVAEFRRIRERWQPLTDAALDVIARRELSDRRW